MIAHASAPGKAILCGEHAVVYGQPAIALPVAGVTASAEVSGGTQAGIVVEAPDIDAVVRLDLQSDHPLAGLIARTFEALSIHDVGCLNIVLRSTIPIASGMGSGAAVSAALVKALGAYYGVVLDPATVSTLVYESERYYHGTPSGIDNTVVSFARPIWYRRGAGKAPPLLEPLTIGAGLTLVIGDTGVRCPTRITVGRVRERWSADQAAYDRLFGEIGATVEAVRVALRRGDIPSTGKFLDRNHELLQSIGVSSEELDRLVGAARHAGAVGAKLSGGGGGGIMLGLVESEYIESVEAALRAAGAARIIVTSVDPAGPEALLV
jgi:mevalonate kinase